MTAAGRYPVNIIAGAVSVAAFGAACLIGPANLTISESLSGLFAGSEPAATIVREIRLPRALAAWLAGAALGAAGAGLQGLLRNPLADPGVLGVSGFAALGAVVAIYFNLAAMSALATPIAAIAFALGATALLYFLGAGRISTTRLILVGVGLSAAAGALITLVMNIAPNPFILTDMVNWLFGSVANRSFDNIVLIAPFMMAGAVFLYTVHGGLMALTLGEETASSIGADVGKVRLRVIASAALLAGSSVALAGGIGFVGIVAPHFARPFANHDPGKTIVPAALIGGAMLAIADLVVRLLPFDYELRLGVAAALIGAPAFIWIAARTRRLAR